MKEKEDKIKLLEMNVLEVVNEKTRIENENNVLKKEKGEEEINLQEFKTSKTLRHTFCQN